MKKFIEQMILANLWADSLHLVGTKRKEKMYAFIQATLD
jgi:hypothetical protein